MMHYHCEGQPQLVYAGHCASFCHFAPYPSPGNCASDPPVHEMMGAGASCRYELRAVETRVAAILSASGYVESTLDDGAGPLGVVLEATPFYAEQGGQVADTGLLTGPSCSFDVQDTKVSAPSSCRACLRQAGCVQGLRRLGMNGKFSASPT